MCEVPSPKSQVKVCPFTEVLVKRMLRGAQAESSLTVKPARAGRLIRVDFPTDPSLPGGGPGRAPNGNFAISEVEVLRGGGPVAIEAAWADD